MLLEQGTQFFQGVTTPAGHRLRADLQHFRDLGERQLTRQTKGDHYTLFGREFLQSCLQIVAKFFFNDRVRSIAGLP
jgi:hypothetical protein